jgi:Cu-Zn family superoxide dismutase
MSHRPRLFASAVIVLLGACIDSPTSPRLSTAARSVDATGAVVAGAPASHVEVTLHNVANDEIGFARLTEDAQGRVHLTVHARGLTPGLHGMHLHAVGACVGTTTPAFSSAGGHVNLTGRQHGHHNPLGFHSGDLPNLKVNAAGVGNLSATLEQFSLAALQDANGTALVLHQNEDDLATDTGPLGPGNSGPRIACGVLRSR